MVAGISALKFLVEENLAEKARQTGEYLLNSLKEKLKSPLLKEIRGKGLMVGIEFLPPRQLAGKFASLVAGELLNKYQILTAYTLNNPEVLRLEPALIVEKEEIDKAVSALEEILARPYPVLNLLLKTTGRLLKSYLP